MPFNRWETEIKEWQSGQQKGIIEKIAEYGKTRTEMRIDNLIVAIAVAQKAECIYSEDPHIKAFAQNYINVFPLPNIPVQPTML